MKKKKVKFNKSIEPRCVSKSNINNFEEPVYCIVLEDGPTSTYSSSACIKYICPDAIHAFYQVLPQLAKYYKVTISVIENPDKLPFKSW